ncbi:MAG: chorismate-binding protein, partial [Gammaproteobacteria bacterium]
MSPEKFAELAAQNYQEIPVTRTLLADLDTPLSVYSKLAGEPYTYLLESVESIEKWGRYSIIGLKAEEFIRVSGEKIELVKAGDTRRFTREDPLTYLQEYIRELSVPELEGLPRFAGGLVGYIGYDVVRYVEKRLKDSVPPDELGVPDILLMRSRDLVIFDNFAGTLTLVTHVAADGADAYALAQQRLDQIEQQLQSKQPVLAEVSLGAPHLDESMLKSSLGQEGYEAAVEKIKQYCIAGDIMQVVPSQRLSMEFTEDPINLYRALRAVNPSPYMYFMDLGDFQIVGASPEILARLDHGEVTVRPIAGTRRRGRTKEDDLAMEKDMLDDPKEIAEHLMLIDLGRNDAGRISQTGTVKVTEQMVVERYSHVMHITSNVVGQLKPQLDAIDVLRAVHPAGTLSGAPKIRAMEIIDEIEPVKRCIYGGAVGYIGWNGDMDMAIAIRT